MLLAPLVLPGRRRARLPLGRGGAARRASGWRGAAPLTAGWRWSASARTPAAPSLAIAFIAVSIGLGGFALAYRATLLRATADQAANRVPLDAMVGPPPATSRRRSALAGWRAGSRWRRGRRGRCVARGVRRPAAGGDSPVPLWAFPRPRCRCMHGWRAATARLRSARLARRWPRPDRPGPPARCSRPARGAERDARRRRDVAASTSPPTSRTPAGTVDAIDLGTAAGGARTVRVACRDHPGGSSSRRCRCRRAVRAGGHQRAPERREPGRRDAVDAVAHARSGAAARRPGRRALAAAGTAWSALGGATVATDAAGRLRVASRGQRRRRRASAPAERHATDPGAGRPGHRGRGGARRRHRAQHRRTTR